MNLITYHAVDSPGQMTNVAALDVTNGGITNFTVSTNKSGVTFTNIGNRICWYGGDDVSPTNNLGASLTPRSQRTYTNVQAGFTVYFRSPAGVAATKIGIIEYD